MKAIYDFVNIQIELTNACIHQCSNCTRFCGHHQKPFFMDWDTFKKAVDTTKDWPKLVGIMGGEPTLHPEFERYVEYASEIRPKYFEIGGGVKPTKSLSYYIEDANMVKGVLVNKSLRGLGLWTSACQTYIKHYELIQDTFIIQCVNDHIASSRHQAWLMTRKEFGISDHEWVRMRDNCWWQQWVGSPSVTPKGAFFCEVAAAMDMLFDGPGGWKIENNWWNRTPEDYKEQLMWCEYCSGAFCDLDRDANEQIDDVSPLMYEKLVSIGSPKANNGKIVIHKPADNSVSLRPRLEILQYQPDNTLYVTDNNSYIYPKSYMFVAGKDVGKKILSLGNCGWIIYARNDSYTPPQSFDAIFTNTVFNPGTLHYSVGFDIWLFNTNAKSMRMLGFDGLSRIETIEQLVDAWQQRKVVTLADGFENIINPDIEEWRKNITQSGIMYHHQMNDAFNQMAFRSSTYLDIQAIVDGNDSFIDKMRQLAALRIDNVVSAPLTSKFKTAIHNCLAKYISLNGFNLQDVKQQLKSEADNYCAYYALAMLETNMAKKQALAKCILDYKNNIGLGICALWEDVNYDEQTDNSIMEDLINILREKPILLGNRYTSKSIYMIAANLGYPTPCFADDERHGTVFGETMTYSIRDALKKFTDSLLLMTVDGKIKRYILSALSKTGYSDLPISLHQLTLAEMGPSKEVTSEILKSIHEISTLSDVGFETLTKLLYENLS